MSYSVVYALGGVPGDVTEVCSIVMRKIANGRFAPSIEAKAAIGNEEHIAYFPVFTLELKNRKQLEEFRKALHAKVDQTLDSMGSVLD